MSASSTTRWLLLGALVLFGAVASVVGMSVWIQAKGLVLKETLQTIANEKSILQEQSQLTAVLHASAIDREALRTYVLEGNDGAVQLLSEIDTIAALLGITVTTSQLQVEETEEEFDKLLLSFDIEGQERNVVQALLVFEALPYASEITQVQLSRTPTGSAGIQMMRGTISLRVSIE